MWQSRDTRHRTNDIVTLTHQPRIFNLLTSYCVKTNRSLFATLSSVFCYVSLNLLWKWYQQGSYLHCCQCVLGQLKASHAWGIRGRRCRQCWVTGGGCRLLAVFCRSSKKVPPSKPVLIDTDQKKSGNFVSCRWNPMMQLVQCQPTTKISWMKTGHLGWGALKTNFDEFRNLIDSALGLQVGCFDMLGWLNSSITILLNYMSCSLLSLLFHTI